MGNDTTAAGALHVAVRALSVTYRRDEAGLDALHAIDLQVRRGEFLSIIGPSGCGKSTLLRVIGGLQAATAGAALIDGREPREAQRRKDIGFVFQDPSLLPWRTVAGNVALPAQVNRKPAGSGDQNGLIDLVGLSRFRDYYPHQLSGGMQQRVALARSLVTSPSLLLMDEPFGALDEITRSAMRYELLRIWRASAEQPRTVIFVTHSVAEAVLLSDRVVVMTPQPGRIAGMVDVDLPRPRTEETEAGAEFIELTARIRALLRDRVAA
ncbi:MAG TPA: ABC transporter ATP-binding protein [Dehalococcoidia bacterium]